MGMERINFIPSEGTKVSLSNKPPSCHGRRLRIIKLHTHTHPISIWSIWINALPLVSFLRSPRDDDNSSASDLLGESSQDSLAEELRKQERKGEDIKQGTISVSVQPQSDPTGSLERGNYTLEFIQTRGKEAEGSYSLLQSITGMGHSSRLQTRVLPALWVPGQSGSSSPRALPVRYKGTQKPGKGYTEM